MRSAASHRPASYRPRARQGKQFVAWDVTPKPGSVGATFLSRPAVHAVGTRMCRLRSRPSDQPGERDQTRRVGRPCCHSEGARGATEESRRSEAAPVARSRTACRAGLPHPAGRSVGRACLRMPAASCHPERSEGSCSAPRARAPPRPAAGSGPHPHTSTIERRKTPPPTDAPTPAPRGRPGPSLAHLSTARDWKRATGIGR